MVDLKELDLLELYLKEHDYNYSREDTFDNISPAREWHQIVVKGVKNNPLWDAICHYGSYGYKHGLLEVSGIIAGDSPDGCRYNLTAADVISLLEVK